MPGERKRQQISLIALPRGRRFWLSDGTRWKVLYRNPCRVRVRSYQPKVAEFQRADGTKVRIKRTAETDFSPATLVEIERSA